MSILDILEKGKWLKHACQVLAPTPEDYKPIEKDLNLLKSGDTVTFSGAAGAPQKTFTIDRYLGTGNSTHIFEITSDSGEKTVLRLPNIADFLGTRNEKYLKIVASQLMEDILIRLIQITNATYLQVKSRIKDHKRLMIKTIEIFILADALSKTERTLYVMKNTLLD